MKILEKTMIGAVELQNRIVMAPMTRSRAFGNVPNALMAEYYGQRAGAGLIISEGTSPSPNGLGYARIPGIFNEEQVEGWKNITTAVHNEGGKIFIQLMHTGRIGHPLNLPKDSVIMAPSSLKSPGQVWTDSEKLQDYQMPKEMSIEDINLTKKEYIDAAINAMEAGFDGVELHGANGYLLEQFISPISNIRTDNYGGTIENRSRFVLEVAQGVADAIGGERIGIRLSPYGVSGGMLHYPEIDETYKYLAEELNKIGIAYIHIADHSSLGAPTVPIELKQSIRRIFNNSIILSGGYDLERAEQDIEDGLGDVVAFGRPFINNPDLVERFQNDWSLSTDLKKNLFYIGGEQGYTDYPFSEHKVLEHSL